MTIQYNNIDVRGLYYNKVKDYSKPDREFIGSKYQLTARKQLRICVKTGDNGVRLVDLRYWYCWSKMGEPEVYTPMKKGLMIYFDVYEAIFPLLKDILVNGKDI